jgi:hypothetical protein
MSIKTDFLRLAGLPVPVEKLTEAANPLFKDKQTLATVKRALVTTIAALEHHAGTSTVHNLKTMYHNEMIDYDKVLGFFNQGKHAAAVKCWQGLDHTAQDYIFSNASADSVQAQALNDYFQKPISTSAPTAESVDLDEAFKLNDTVTIVKGPKDVIGKTGTIGEIRHGIHKTAAKTYTVDYDNGQSIQLDSTSLRAVKKSNVQEAGMHGKAYSIGVAHGKTGKRINPRDSFDEVGAAEYERGFEAGSLNQPSGAPESGKELKSFHQYDESEVVAEADDKIKPVVIDVEASTESGLETKDKEIEKEEKQDDSDKVSVPAEVLKDIEDAITELKTKIDDKYVAHLPNIEIELNRYAEVIEILQSMLVIFKSGCPYNIKRVTVLLTSLDSVMKLLVPSSVWKFLSIEHFNKGMLTSLKDLFKEIKLNQ